MSSVSEIRNQVRKKAIIYSIIILAVLILLVLLGAGIHYALNNKNKVMTKNEHVTSVNNETEASYNDNTDYSDNTDYEAEANTDHTPATEMQTEVVEETYSIDPIHKSIIDDLLYRNAVIVNGYYYGQHFSETGSYVDWLGYNLPQVSATNIGTYNDLINYLKNTYTGSPNETNSIVYKFTMPAKYLSGAYGELLYNVNFVEDGQDYYSGNPQINLNEYVIKSAEQSGDRLDFIVQFQGTGGDRMDISATAVNQYGKWLLTSVIY